MWKLIVKGELEYEKSLEDLLCRAFAAFAISLVSFCAAAEKPADLQRFDELDNLSFVEMVNSVDLGKKFGTDKEVSGRGRQKPSSTGGISTLHTIGCRKYAQQVGRVLATGICKKSLLNRL